MKYAILSDVHANPAALKTVLADARRRGAGKTICLGDVVGYGPEAEAAVNLVRSEMDVCLMGNHDAAVSAVITGSGFSLHALRGVSRHRGETSVETRQWLSELPYVWAGDGFACAHGDFTDPSAFRYVMTPEDAVRSLNARAESVLFVGHTHVAAVFEAAPSGSVRSLEPNDTIAFRADCRYLVNVGSVGYPRHDVDSTYCIYDAETRLLSCCRVAFDFEGYERVMQAHDAALPAWFEDRRRRLR